MLPVGVDEVPQFIQLCESVTDCGNFITTLALSNKSIKSPTRFCSDRKAWCRAQTHNAGPPSTEGRRRNARRLKVYRSMKNPVLGSINVHTSAMAHEPVFDLPDRSFEENAVLVSLIRSQEPAPSGTGGYASVTTQRPTSMLTPATGHARKTHDARREDKAIKSAWISNNPTA